MRRPTRAEAGARERDLPEPAPGVLDAWWKTVLAGGADEPHPIHGERVTAHVRGGRIVISGQVESRRDRDELVRQARRRIGNGIREVDDGALRVVDRPERRGILDQTLIAAFQEPEVAHVVRDFVTEHARVRPKAQDIVQADQKERLRKLLPAEFLPDAERALQKNTALLILRVDETDAFTVRRLLEQDSRSTWTLALPPHLAGKGV